MLAAARLKLWGWPAAAVVAAAFIALSALHGERPEPGLARFAAAGLLARWPIADVAAVAVSAGARQLSFRRRGGAWYADGAATAIPADVAERIATGLTLLHNSAPLRADLAPAQLGEFGLDPPQLTVTATMTDGARVTIAFGGRNPIGLQRYARVAGRAAVLLLPAFVADTWQQVVVPR